MTTSIVDMSEFFPAAGSHFAKKDAEVIGPVLVKLAEDHRSTPLDIVEEARSDESPLHPYFEWDDEMAAEQYRLEQARYMARSIKVRFVDPDGENREVRAFESIIVTYRTKDDLPEIKRQYQPITVVQGEKEQAQQIIDRSYRELQLWASRYGDYRVLFEEYEVVFAPVFDAISKVAETIAQLNQPDDDEPEDTQ